MADKLMIVMATCDPGKAEELLTPLVQATVAAAMEYEVEIILAGRCSVLARPGVAAGLLTGLQGANLLELMREARRAGVSFKACLPAQETDSDGLIAEIDESVGDAYLISEAMDDATVTFTW